MSVCMYICVYVCMYVYVGLVSRLAWHHHLGVMETALSGPREQPTNRCSLGGGGGVGGQERLSTLSSGGLLCSSSGLGRGNAGSGGKAER